MIIRKKQHLCARHTPTCRRRSSSLSLPVVIMFFYTNVAAVAFAWTITIKPNAAPVNRRIYWRIPISTRNAGVMNHYQRNIRNSGHQNQQQLCMSKQTEPDTAYYTVMESPVQTAASSQGTPRITLTRYLDQVCMRNPELKDLESLLLAIQMACKTIANLVNRAGLVYSDDNNANNDNAGENFSDGRYYSMRRLDQLSTRVLKNALKFTGNCDVVAPAAKVDSESPANHQPGVLIAQSLDSKYAACLDPLDGSGNADASICTGTVFGVFEQQTEDSSSSSSSKPNTEKYSAVADSVLQPAQNMRAAGYCLYSSSTVLVFSFGDTVQGFTLDPQVHEFVLTHPDLTIPTRGNVYSVNEANAEGWENNFKDYLRDLKTGQGQTQKRYAHRYVGSMVGDVHRTLLYGGIFCYPRDNMQHPEGNLQLLYKTAPMAFILKTAGGLAMDQNCTSLLQVKPERVHQKSPCFMGSPDDVEELQSYLLKK